VSVLRCATRGGAGLSKCVYLSREYISQMDTEYLVCSSRSWVSLCAEILTDTMAQETVGKTGVD